MGISKLRLRHPKGVSTIEIDLCSASVQDLQSQIHKLAEILPSQQDLKAGYPTRHLALISELPVSSLGLKAGDQIIVSQRGGSLSESTVSPLTSFPSSSTTAPKPQTGQAASANIASLNKATSKGENYVEAGSGVLVHRVVPDDNSCLFSSVALVFENGMGRAQNMRKVVADAIKNDPINWSEAMLGHPREKYIETILKPSSWGGAIELSILASHYKAEIASIDVETGRIDRFQPSTGQPSNRCILIYSGIHYDAATLAPMANAPADFHQTVFPIEGEDAQTDSILKAATQLVDILRAKHSYTNTSTFDLRCEICKIGLKGEKGAREHASQTGHTAFGEY